MKAIEKEESWKDDLLMCLLSCGSEDLKKLERMIKLAEKFDISIWDIFDEALSDFQDDTGQAHIGYNELMFEAMEMIKEAVAREVEDRGEKEIAQKVFDTETTINYSDSWFNIPPLDSTKVFEKSKDEIVEEVINYFKQH